MTQNGYDLSELNIVLAERNHMMRRLVRGVLQELGVQETLLLQCSQRNKRSPGSGGRTPYYGTPNEPFPLSPWYLDSEVLDQLPAGL